MSLRITFAKSEVMSFTGHFDLHRTWERTVRRARLPLAYSQGFNPRPKINLAAALPLGFTSSCELVEIWLETELPEVQIFDQLMESVPPGMEISQVEAIDQNEKKIPNLVNAVEYQITLIEQFPDLIERIDLIWLSKTIFRERRGKTYDLRPLLEWIKVLPASSDGYQLISLRLAARTGATGRPDEVLNAMGIPIYQARIHRTAIILKTS